MDLKKTRKTIKKTIMRFTCQVLKHLINEWQGEVVFPDCLIEPPIIDANSVVVLHLSWDQLVLFIFNNCEACPFGNHIDEADPLTI